MTYDDHRITELLKKTNLFARYVDEIDDLETISNLEKAIQERKKKLEEK